MNNPWIIQNRTDLLGNPLPINQTRRARMGAFVSRPSVKACLIGSAFVVAGTAATCVSRGMALFPSCFAAVLATAILVLPAQGVITAGFSHLYGKIPVWLWRGRKEDFRDITINTAPDKVKMPDPDSLKISAHLKREHQDDWIPLAFGVGSFTLFSAISQDPFLATYSVGLLVPPVRFWFCQRTQWKKIEAGEWRLEGYKVSPVDAVEPAGLAKSKPVRWLINKLVKNPSP